MYSPSTLHKADSTIHNPYAVSLFALMVVFAATLRKAEHCSQSQGRIGHKANRGIPYSHPLGQGFTIHNPHAVSLFALMVVFAATLHRAERLFVIKQ